MNILKGLSIVRCCTLVIRSSRKLHYQTTPMLFTSLDTSSGDPATGGPADSAVDQVAQTLGTGDLAVSVPMATSSSSSSSSSVAPAAEREETVDVHDLVMNARDIQAKIESACHASERDASTVDLVAVSKVKPVSDIQVLYDAGFRKFGENYFQELCEKAPALPADIQWHFIGHLQSQKAGKLIRDVPNLSVLETLDSIKLATKLNTACESADRAQLDVYIQVDTSGEATKSGVSGAEIVELAAFIKNNCPRLSCKGLMTIGAPGNFDCFDQLAAARRDVAAVLDLESEDQLLLSMGMSGDFEEAIRRGSTSVRVGSSIFGARSKKA